MGITVSFFASAQELSGFIEQQLAETRNLLLSLSKRLDQARKEFDGSRTDSKSNPKGDTRQTEIEGFRVLVNPAANYELNLLDEAINSAQEKVEALERADRVIPSLKDSIRVAAIFDDGIPTAFMHYTNKR